MIDDPRLETLAKGLQHWRSVEKKHRGEPYPSDFLSQARVLAKELGTARVAVATGIQPQKLSDPKKGPARRGRKQKPRNYSKISSEKPPERLVLELSSGKQVICHVGNAGVVLAEMINHV